MVIVQLKGGLGNQMFQYAAARRIAYMNNTSLKLDISYFESSKLRTYDLGCFNIIEDFASTREIRCLKRLRERNISDLVFRFIEKCKPYYRRKYIKEISFNFDLNMLKVSGNAYIEGYWQSEKYFKDVENIIRKEFTIKYKS
ncbi:unnamed protein product, partial [marine sediment metagenome]